jgi:hypothetical protein
MRAVDEDGGSATSTEGLLLLLLLLLRLLRPPLVLVVVVLEAGAVRGVFLMELLVCEEPDTAPLRSMSVMRTLCVGFGRVRIRGTYCSPRLGCSRTVESSSDDSTNALRRGGLRDNLPFAVASSSFRSSGRARVDVRTSIPVQMSSAFCCVMASRDVSCCP